MHQPKGIWGVRRRLSIARLAFFSTDGCEQTAGKKRGPQENLGPCSCEGNKNLQRGTAAAVALGGEATKDASAGFGMLFFWARSNHLICMTAMSCAHSCTFLRRTMPPASGCLLLRQNICF
ncbi:hypothetical protein FKV68_09950 [Sinorhizobium mexicanum]|uniref:Uncharacterized protein n=1 Tax=Sinorhizobium mexicanum TaxID=375549 RepID=A0A859QK67_9HYPH|nr:hypothetical protein FKV68_09950 [Sinorhizobium mexicanum]